VSSVRSLLSLRFKYFKSENEKTMNDDEEHNEEEEEEEDI